MSLMMSLMTCSTTSMHPISLGSREKTWWNSKSNATAFRARSGGHSLRQSNPPSFCRVARRRSCLCWVESLIGSGLLGSSSSKFLSRSSEHWASGTALAATTWPMTCPWARWISLSVCPHDIQPIREICLAIRVGRLHHNVQLVPHHHHVLGMTTGNDGLETWYCTLVGEQDLLVQVQGVLCSVGWEFESFSQACSSKLETLCPLKGDPGCLPLQWSFVYLLFLHSLYYPVDSGSAQDDWDPSGKCTRVIQDKDDLLFIVLGQPLYLHPH